VSEQAARELVLVDVLRALSDPTRLLLVVALADGDERAWGDLKAPVAKSTLSHHLSTLRDAGLTTTRQEGRRCYVRLRRDVLEQQFPGLLTSVLDAARPTGE